MAKNTPYLSLASALIFVAFGVGIVISGHAGANDGSLLIGLVVSTVPSILAASFAERTSRDVRNGTVTDKARLGTHKALEEAGVVTRQGPVVASLLMATQAQTAALSELIEQSSRRLESKIEVHGNGKA